MTSSEYLINKLTNLVNSFPTIKCAYEFDSFDNTHTVEISPSEFYNNNQTFYKLSSEIDKEFISKFPFEGLYFIDSNDLIPIQNIMFEVKGRDYELLPLYSYASPQTICIPTYGKLPLFLNLLNENVLGYIKEAFTPVCLSTRLNEIEKFNGAYLNVNDALKQIANPEVVGNNFAMAA